MDLNALDYAEFELLIGLLLQREGFRVLKAPRFSDGPVGMDYEATDSLGGVRYVEVKHFRKTILRSSISQFLGDIARLRESNPNARGLLVISGTLPEKIRSQVVREQHVELWDGDTVHRLLAKHPDVAASAKQTASSRAAFMSLQTQLLSEPPDTRSTELLRRLEAVPPGKPGWRDFEKIGVDILSHVFSPALGPPEIQNRSDDGLDIIDAIYPIRSRDQPWAWIRSEYGTRFVVAEFKNYSELVGQKQVESLVQYLWKPAKRNFGVLVCRSGPSESALIARRRAWLEMEKCVVFLQDDDLKEMIGLSGSDSDPFEIIDAQLEDFFRGLTP